MGEIEGLFETTRLRFHDLPVRDKGDGPSRVVELVLRRTLQPPPTFPGPAVASQALNRFLRPQLTLTLTLNLTLILTLTLTLNLTLNLTLTLTRLVVRVLR